MSDIKAMCIEVQDLHMRNKTAKSVYLSLLDSQDTARDLDTRHRVEMCRSTLLRHNAQPVQTIFLPIHYMSPITAVEHLNFLVLYV